VFLGWVRGHEDFDPLVFEAIYGGAVALVD